MAFEMSAETAMVFGGSALMSPGFGTGSSSALGFRAVNPASPFLLRHPVSRIQLECVLAILGSQAINAQGGVGITQGPELHRAVRYVLCGKLEVV